MGMLRPVTADFAGAEKWQGKKGAALNICHAVALRELWYRFVNVPFQLIATLRLSLSIRACLKYRRKIRTCSIALHQIIKRVSYYARTVNCVMSSMWSVKKGLFTGAGLFENRFTLLNQRLNVTRSHNFSSIKTFLTYCLCFVQFEIIQTQNWRTNNKNRKPHWQKPQIKVLSNPGLASPGLGTTRHCTRAEFSR